MFVFTSLPAAGLTRWLTGSCLALGLLGAVLPAQAQPTVLGTDLPGGSYGTFNLNPVGGFRQYRLQASASSPAGSWQWQFAQGTAGAEDYSTNWRPYTSDQTLAGYNQVVDPATQAASARFNSGFGGQPGKLPAVVSGRYYTFNVTSLGAGSNNSMAVLETVYSPVAISTVSQSPATPGRQSQVRVTATLAAAPHAAEYFYLRYSTDNFATSAAVAMAVSGSTATALIPGQAASTAVRYYVFSSPIATVAGLGSGYDMLTLNLNNNSGANYSYTVATGIAGSYGIDNVTGSAAGSNGVFDSFANAITFLNATTVTGPTTFNVTAGQTFSEGALTVLRTGTASNGIAFSKAGTAANPVILTTATGASSAAVDLHGVSYVTFDGIDIGLAAANAAGPIYGYRIRNRAGTPILGAGNNLIQNATISLNRATGGSYGAAISSNTSFNGTAPTTTGGGASATCSNNVLRNLSIRNSQNGILLASANTSATLTLSDYGNEVANCTVGEAGTADDLGGNGSTAANYGIYSLNEYRVSIHDNTIQNVTGRQNFGLAALYCYGTGADASTIYNNRISNIRSVGASTSNFSYGARLGVAAASASTAATLNFYNNIISRVTGSTTSATTSRSSVGISVVGNGSNPASSQVVNLYYNTVVIDPSDVFVSATNNGTLGSNACIELAALIQPTNIVNNILANLTNYTGTSTSARHFCIITPASSGPVGGVGSVCNYNDLYIQYLQNGTPASSGFIGQYGSSNFQTLAQWQGTAGTPDLNSVAADPGFNAVFKPTNTSALDNKGTPLAGISTDIAGLTRGAGAAGSSTAPDLGAYEFVPAAISIRPTALTAPASTGCYGTDEAVSVSVQNSGAATLDFAANPLTVTVNVTGAVTATVSTTISTGTLAAGASQSVAVGTLNMSAAGTYTFAVAATVSGDQNTFDDVLTPAPAAITVTPPSIGSIAASTTTLCQSGNVTLTATGAAGGTVTWFSSADGYSTAIGTGTPLVVTGVAATTSYQARVVCGGSVQSAFSNTVTVTVNTPALTGTSSPVSAGCAGGTATLTATANAGATIYWYDSSSSALVLATGSTYAPTVAASRQYFAAATVPGADQTAGRSTVPASTATNGSLGNTGLQFNALSDFVLKTVTVYPTASTATTTTFYLRNSGGTVLASKEVNLPAGSSTVVTPVVVTLDFAIAAGTGYQLLQTTNLNSLLIRENTSVFPLTTAGVVTVTNGINPAVTTGSYYFFYNWVVAPICSSPRTAVQVNVSPLPTATLSSSGPVCAGSAATVSIALTGTGPWDFTYTDGSTPVTVTGSTANPYTFTTPALSSATTYTLTSLNDASCAGAGAGLGSTTIAVNTTTTFTGAVDGSWHTPGNWSNCLPSALVSAIIPSGATVELSSGTGSTSNLSIAGTGSLTLAGSAVLDIKGNFATAGLASFTAGPGSTTSFSGPGTQSIGAGTYYNLVVAGSGSAAKSLSADIVVTNNVDLTNGMLNSNGNELQMNSLSGAFLGAGAGHYVVTNGSTGRVRFNNVGAGGRGSVTFPIGTISYTPATLANTGTADYFVGTVMDGISRQGTAITSHVVNKTWNISEGTAGGSAAALTLQWNASDELASFERSNATIAHYENGEWNAPCFTCYGPAAGSNPYLLTRTGLTSFSPFGVEDATMPLPVELTRFDARRQGSRTELSWATASEKNNRGFDVQVSSNGRDFRALGFVGAAGTGNRPQAYAYTDDEAGKTGLRYYRLRQVDHDGTASFSPVRSVLFDQPLLGLSAAPNPFRQELQVSVQLPTAQAACRLTLSDAAGRVLRRYQLDLPAGLSQQRLTGLEDLPKGLYLLRVAFDSKPQHLKVVKE
ncbi:hypothetical protein GCM10023185_12880 [Hymenobacter saemangeumensis]|uniref:Ig-like domain-containing protein n=1 Tax=Hymenobacter saemangeumensis TaxID=1084522 RepID=A0ABP8I7C5_9BACT